MQILEQFSRDGFVVLHDVFTKNESIAIERFTEFWIKFNISRSLGSLDQIHNFDLVKYHEIKRVDHSMVASASYRYCIPPKDITALVHKKELRDFIKGISSAESLEVWQDQIQVLVGLVIE